MGVAVCGYGQNRLSADVTIRQVHKGKAMRVEKQVYYNMNGNLVVHYTYPQEYYWVTNSLGESSVYQPKVNEVMVVNDRSMSSEAEYFVQFLSPDYADLGLTRNGFALKGVEREGDNVVKTFLPTNINEKSVKKVVVVCRDGRPIYCAIYGPDDHITRKVYYSKYVTFPKLTFPTSITQISYNAVGDSIIKKEEYKNIKTKDFAPGALFDYKVPAGAKRVNPYGVNKK